MTWNPWTSYDEVPPSILNYEYNDQKRIQARDPEYLRSLNALFNPQPGVEQELESPKAQCSLCSRELTSVERKTRLCTKCQKFVAKHGEVRIPCTDWNIRYVGGAL